MRPDTIKRSHAGIPSTEGYSRDPEGAREWLEDVLRQADEPRLNSNVVTLNVFQRLAIRLLGLAPYIEQRKAWEFARGLRYVARTALTFFPFDTAQPSAPKGGGSTD